MIGIVERILKKTGLMSPFSDDDIINAEIEDTAREHRGLVEKLHASFFRRLSSDEALRESIKIAKVRTNSFADFENLTIRREEGKQ